MAIVGYKQLTFSSGGDLSQATVTSEIVDVRDLRNLVVVIPVTGTPTGSLVVTHYYGFPQHTSTGGKSWTNNVTTTEATFSPAGAAATYKHIINSSNGMPCSAYSLAYTRTSGTGSITAIQQCKGSGSA